MPGNAWEDHPLAWRLEQWTGAGPEPANSLHGKVAALSADRRGRDGRILRGGFRLPGAALGLVAMRRLPWRRPAHPLDPADELAAAACSRLVRWMLFIQ